MDKIKKQLDSLRPILDLVRDIEKSKLAKISSDIAALQVELSALRSQSVPCPDQRETSLASSGIVQESWIVWKNQKANHISMSLIELAAEREQQKKRLSTALGRADVIGQLHKRAISHRAN